MSVFEGSDLGGSNVAVVTRRLVRPAPVDTERVQLQSQSALADRLRTAAPYLTHDALPTPDPDPACDAATLLELLVDAVARQPGNDRIWLLLTAVSAAFPTRGEVDRTRRRLELLDHRAAVVSILDDTLDVARKAGEVGAGMDIVVGGVIVDVDHSAKYDLHTGIQRVSRSLLPLWNAGHDVVPGAWTDQLGALRQIGPVEFERVMNWSSRKVVPTEDPIDPAADSPSPRLLVPWRSVVVMVEVPPGDVCDRLAAVGDYSGNRLVGVVHDAIPVVSADMVPIEDSSRFVRYLTAVKFASRMAGVSSSATSEIAGFVAALATQGLSGPTVLEVPLGAPDAPPATSARVPPEARPMVLVVGSHEPRKNHLGILHSAEVLWREGHEFSLTFVGGSGWGDEFPRRAAELQRARRPIRIRRAVPEAALEKAYEAASFTVFPSLHEGFGLPVTESLAHGTPVITSDFGSMAETSAAGGTLMIDPRDDDALTAAMRTLLTDPATLNRLREEIAGRPRRSWQDYADELWDQLVAPELRTLSGAGR